jgi:hypothetical protein
MTAIMKTREERREELKQLAARPNGIDKLYSVLTRNFGGVVLLLHAGWAAV